MFWLARDYETFFSIDTTSGKITNEPLIFTEGGVSSFDSLYFTAHIFSDAISIDGILQNNFNITELAEYSIMINRKDDAFSGVRYPIEDIYKPYLKNDISMWCMEGKCSPINREF